MTHSKHQINLTKFRKKKYASFCFRLKFVNNPSTNILNHGSLTKRTSKNSRAPSQSANSGENKNNKTIFTHETTRFIKKLNKSNSENNNLTKSNQSGSFKKLPINHTQK